MPNKKGKYRVYDRRHAETLIKLMGKGWLNCEIMAELNINEECFYRWIKENEHFKEAYDLGLQARKSWWVAKGREMMENPRKGNNKIWNKFIEVVVDEFKKAPEGANNTTNISIQNMQVLQQKDRAGLLDFIHQSIKRNPEADIQLIEVLPDNEPNSSAS